MASKTRGLRVPEELEREIEREAEAVGKSWSAMTKDLLTEAIKMRRAPGVVFADGPAGRRPVVAGSGLDVWEVIATWRAGGEDRAKLRESLHWLTEALARGLPTSALNADRYAFLRGEARFRELLSH